MPSFYVAIDDTDNAEDDGNNKGTGSKSRALARELVELVGGRHLGITRHQLLLDPAVRYTSHNSSACIVLGAEGEPDEVIAALVEASELYLPEIASPGADVGLCVAESTQIAPEVVAWGWRAKNEVLAMADAQTVAQAAGIHLVGLTGDHGGVIGALAAVGLRASGSDGRFLELGDLRRAVGDQPAAVFIAAGVERFVSGDEEVELAPEELITVGLKHAQPVLQGGRPTLLLDPDSARGAWRAAPREAVRQF
jgi:hypothetical protein